MKRLFLTAVMLAVVLTLVAGVMPAMAQSGNTWRADYYNNPDWAGAPVATEFASFLSFDWGYGSPSPAVPVDNFTARFTTDAFFYAGNYNFSLIADDEIVLLIDGVPYLDTRGQGQSGKLFNIMLSMWQGQHRVEVLFREWSQTAYVYVNWAYSGSGGASPPPSTPIGPKFPPLPPSTDSVQTKFGNYTPCLQQGIHQSHCFVSDGAWDSPNLGSIQMEPQIQSWVNCKPADQISTFYLSPEVPMKGYKCSRTMAGWFPN
jgi:hypothetical protein